MSQKPLDVYPVGELIALARAHSPYYQRLYASLPGEPSLADLPIIDQEEYWQAHTRDRREVLTAAPREGFVLNSGGTTGAPKYSYCDTQEWETGIALSARAFEAAGLRDGDRVANLFAAGNLYASFLYATASMLAMERKVLQLPLGYAASPGPAAGLVHALGANVLAGFPTHLLRIIDQIDQDKLEGVRIDRIVYGGELFTADQHAFLQTRFPGIEVRSAGYATVDAGLIGYADAACAAGEHRLFDGATLIEILDDETGQPVEDTGQPGRIVFTNLYRRLMPLLRYPSGDRAQWVEAPGTVDRKFRLLGRSEEAARVGSDMLQVSEAKAFLEPFRDRLGIEDFQLLVTRENLHDALTFRLVSHADAAMLDAGGEEILAAFRSRRPDFDDAARKGIMHPPRVEWVRRGQLTIHERTGKLLRVVDRRDG